MGKILTDKAIDCLEAAARPYKRADRKVPGLYVEVYPNGKKYWRFKYTIDGKEKRISLGPYPEVGLKKARGEATDCRLDLRKGVDPSKRRAQALAEALPLTFGQVAEEWAAQFLIESQRAPSTIKRNKVNLRKHIMPALGPMPIKDITPMAMLNFLRPLAERGTLETASRVRIICGQIFKYAVWSGKVDHDPTQDIRGALPAPLNNHYPTVTNPAEVGELLRKIWGYPGNMVVATALKILPYVFTRPGELRQATWAEFDLEGGLWRIPGARMKMRRDHLVPLARQVVELLKNLRYFSPGKSPYAFPGYHDPGKPMSDGAYTRAMRLMGYSSGDMTAHGFRSLASTLLNERGYNPDWIEAQLAHKDSNSIRAIYNRALYLPERRQMMQEWADYLDGLRQGEEE